MTISPLLLRAPDILRAAGCKVVEYEGWRTRGRPYDFEPLGMVVHHDGSPVGPAKPPEAYAHFLFEVGRPDEGIPAPLCQFWIDFYGRWWVGAAGRANHALGATGWGLILPHMAALLSAGIEMDNTTDEPTTSDQYEALHRGLPALFKAYGWDPMRALAGHKEVDYPRKGDPDDISMPQLRIDVRDFMQHPLGEDWFDMADEDDLKNALRAVLDEGTGQGQKDWAGTSMAQLGMEQTNYNLLVQIAEIVTEGTFRIQMVMGDGTVNPAQYKVDGLSRAWIKSQEDLHTMGAEDLPKFEVPASNTWWTYELIGEGDPTTEAAVLAARGG